MRYALTYTRLKKRAETATNNFVLKRFIFETVPTSLIKISETLESLQLGKYWFPLDERRSLEARNFPL